MTKLSKKMVEQNIRLKAQSTTCFSNKLLKLKLAIKSTKI